MFHAQTAVASDLVRARIGLRLAPGLGLILADALALALAFVLATSINEVIQTKFHQLDAGEFYAPYLDERIATVSVLALGILLWLAHARHYTSRRPYWTEVKQIFFGLIAAAMVDGWIQFAFKVQPSRLWQFQLWVYATLLILSGRALVRCLFARAGWWQLGTVVIGTAEGVGELRRFVEREQSLGYLIETVLISAGAQDRLLSELRRALAAGRIRHALIDCRSMPPRLLEQIVGTLDLARVSYCLMPPLRSMPLLDLEVQHFIGHDFILLHSHRQPLDRRRSRTSKRIFDVVVAGLTLLGTLPFLTVIAMLVKLDGGPAFYASSRLGRDGSRFRAFKFRTMQLGAERVLHEMIANDPVRELEWKNNFKLKNDPRITWLGKFLRDTSLDELPQLFNVLRGEMSIVGPRPLLLDEIESYGPWLDLYVKSLPGITGIWQVSGRDSLAYERRIELNNWYVRNWSLWHDIVILLKTIVVVVQRKSAS
jgi:undecaprenyl-phosphate galactose phosphotransferase